MTRGAVKMSKPNVRQRFQCIYLFFALSTLQTSGLLRSWNGIRIGIHGTLKSHFPALEKVMKFDRLMKSLKKKKWELIASVRRTCLGSDFNCGYFHAIKEYCVVCACCVLCVMQTVRINSLNKMSFLTFYRLKRITHWKTRWFTAYNRMKTSEFGSRTTNPSSSTWHYKPVVLIFSFLSVMVILVATSWPVDHIGY